MSKIIIQKEKMRAALAELMKESRVAAPVQDGKITDFIEVTDAQKILMGDELAYKSPKEFFFPRCEKIITFKDGEALPAAPQKDLVLFGARPCDLEALSILTAVFTEGKYADPFFKANLDASLIIGVSCREQKPGCFCDRRETDMNYSESCDLFLRDEGETYTAAYISEKGKTRLGGLIQELNEFYNHPAADNTQQEQAPPLTLDAAELDMFDKIDWAALTETCQGCGLCTYICPTCHCFVFKDVEGEGEICRYRNWDSCMFPKFTLHASGQNPRASVKERYRQRVLHKYSYVKENFGRVACTGCGRCVRSCPAGVNIKTIVEKIKEELG